MVVSSLLAAERDRFRTGRGQNVEFALKDAAAAIIGHLGMIGRQQFPINKEENRAILYMEPMAKILSVHAVVEL